jgi:hypothetical protein
MEDSIWVLKVALLVTPVDFSDEVLGTLWWQALSPSLHVSVSLEDPR